MTVTIGPELPADSAAIAEVLTLAFDGHDEAGLVAALRADGCLDLALTARTDDGTVVGYMALSPLKADFSALALAPVAVKPGWQRQGIGGKLIHAAFAARPGHTIVVLGDPAYYGRFGFRVVEWDCAYAGPYLQAAGPHMPASARIDYAPAFAGLG